MDTLGELGIHTAHLEDMAERSPIKTLPAHERSGRSSTRPRLSGLRSEKVLFRREI